QYWRKSPAAPTLFFFFWRFKWRLSRRHAIRRRRRRAEFSPFLCCARPFTDAGFPSASLQTNDDGRGSWGVRFSR
ncbi:hypothetical protein CSUI_011548, partial [Cystoisospora suis]